MNEMEAFINKSREKQLIAKELYDLEHYSTSVTNSFYAMHLMARALLLKKGIRTKSHRGLNNQFYLEYVEKEGFDADIFSSLQNAQSLREKSDYVAFDEIDITDAENTLKDCEIFMKEAEKFL